MHGGVGSTDVTVRMLWEKEMHTEMNRMRERMVSRGLDQWDWYIVPAGALGRGSAAVMRCG